MDKKLNTNLDHQVILHIAGEKIYYPIMLFDKDD